MGDRALVTFTDDGNTYTPAVYMHWHGSAVPDMIRQFQGNMRKGDAGYAAARFCGAVHETMRDRVTGLGLVDAPAGNGKVDWLEYSHGDAGVYVVNVTTGKVQCHAGYGKGFALDPADFADE